MPNYPTVFGYWNLDIGYYLVIGAWLLALYCRSCGSLSFPW
jgi:hypothetical protein